ncbi:(2Fe-2S)-binding protein [Sphingobium sp. H39-3-25]|uniref:(2Fe-2S)-binding protein n=1 Tax=Sphingobium arseniciresistens TaxID=3030834 RepID=UPI0023B9F5EF|nr:(2Fe-2S)-binding protein [Sphingobium arseniciresistens]
MYITVNGTPHAITAPAQTLLLHVLRNDVRLNGPKYGCGLAQCGACTVLIDNKLARACVLPVGGLVEGARIVTLEGLGTPEAPHPVQAAFIAENATQCGYCLNGMIMTAHALLRRVPDPDDATIRTALRFNLCRCGSHVEVLQAVKTAARAMAAGAGDKHCGPRPAPANEEPS